MARLLWPGDYEWIYLTWDHLRDEGQVVPKTLPPDKEALTVERSTPDVSTRPTEREGSGS